MEALDLMLGHPREHKRPRTQRQPSKIGYERFGMRSRGAGATP